MAVGCGPKCSKVLLVIFNLVFWLSGAAILAVGIWFHEDKEVYDTLKLVSVNRTDPFIKYAIYILIGTGSFVFVVGFLGCCGALRESKCMLGLYIFLLFIVMAAEVGAGVLTFLHHNELEGEVEKDLKDHLAKDELANNKTGVIQYSGFAVLLMYSQYSINCCGIDGPKDYEKLNITKLGLPVLPTCCKMTPEFKANPRDADTSKVADWPACKRDAQAYFQNNQTAVTQLFTTGCKDKIISTVKSKAQILIGLGFGIALLEIIGVVLAICLCSNIGKPTESSE